MYVKALIISALSFTSICCASMHDDEKYVNKAKLVQPDEIEFRDNGMFLMRGSFNEVRLSGLFNEGDGYYAFWQIDYVCGSCGAEYRENPGACEACGSTDIREREIDLWPIG